MPTSASGSDSNKVEFGVPRTKRLEDAKLNIQDIFRSNSTERIPKRHGLIFGTELFGSTESNQHSIRFCLAIRRLGYQQFATDTLVACGSRLSAICD